MNHNDTYGAEDDRAVNVLELRNDAFANMFGFFFVGGGVACEGGEDSDTAPFGTFIECDEEFVEDGGSNGEKGGVGSGG